MGGTNFRDVGGGPATGLADQLIQLLQSGLGGDFSAPSTPSRGRSIFGGGGTGPLARVNQSNPIGRTEGIAGYLNDILSGGAGNLGGSLKKILDTQSTRDVADLRSRFGAGGGVSLGTPAAYAESLYRADAAPKSAVAIGSLQSSVLGPLLQMIASLAGKGVSQRETVAQPSGFASAIGTLAPIVGAIAPFLAPGAGIAKYLGGMAPDTSGFDPSSLWNLQLPSIGGH